MRLRLLLFVLLSVLLSEITFAGGPLVSRPDGVYKWRQSIALTIDGGPLGSLDHDEAVDLIYSCLDEWSNIPSSSISFGPFVLSPSNYELDNLYGLNQYTTAIIFDDSGAITEELYGEGASEFVYGMGGITYIRTSDLSFYTGLVILNGELSSDPYFRRAVLHEIGHMSGLDHSQVGLEQAFSPEENDNDGIALMFPVVLSGCTNNLGRDDIAWVSWLNPELGFTGPRGYIRGLVKRASGAFLNSAHVVAEKIENGRPVKGEVVGAYSGFSRQLKGVYELPYLQPGTYAVFMERVVIDCEALVREPNGLMFPKDYYNGEQESGFDSDNVGDKVLLTVTEHSALSSIDLITNDASSLPLPNLLLAPAPEGWSGSLIATKQTGSTQGTSSFAITDSVYVNWAVANVGNISAGAFRVKLLLDGQEAGRWEVEAGLPPGVTTQQKDIALGVLQRGAHVLRLLIDSESQVVEIDEEDNASEVSLTFGNNAPTVTVGPPQSVKKGVLVTLSGSGADPDGDTITYEWVQVDGPPVVLLDSDKSTASFTSPGLEAEADLVFRLTVRDQWGAQASATVTVTVLPNGAPSFKAGGTIEARPGETVYLVARGSDPDGDSLAFSWSQTAGTSVTLKKAETSVASFTAPAVTTEEELRFRVLVTDSVAVLAADVSVVIKPMVFSTLSVPYGFHGTRFEDTFLGVALFNNCASENQIEACGSDEAGNETFKLTLPGALTPFGQSTFLASDVGGADPGTCTLGLSGKSGSLKGFFMLGDYAMERLDGVGSEPQSGKRLIFPVSASGTLSTQIFVRNDLSAPVEARIRMRDSSGQVSREKYVEIAARSIRSLTPEELWEDLPETANGYLEVTGQTPLAGFQTVGTDTGFAAVGACVPQTGKRLYMPHFYADAAGGNTELRLLNLGTSTAVLTVRGFDDTRASLFTKEVEVKTSGFSVLDLAQVLSQAQVPLSAGVTGYLEIDARLKNALPGASPTVWGVAGFRTSSGAYSILPLVASGKTSELFLHVAESADVRLFTGFAFYNPNTEQAQLTVTAFSPVGVQTATKSFALASGQRLVDLLGNPALFGPGFTQVGGYIRVESTVPVVTFALFGDLRSHYLAAIQGQAAEQ